jgi:hypothetical protein
LFLKINGVSVSTPPKEEEPLNTSEFMKLDAKDVDPEKLFFHKYFGICHNYNIYLLLLLLLLFIIIIIFS